MGSTIREIIMTENNNDIWASNELKVNEDGFVEGYAYTHQFCGGFDVSVAITSYELGDGYNEDMNHVPHVVLSDPDGNIVSEPMPHDSHNPERAIENGMNAAEYIYENQLTDY